MMTRAIQPWMRQVCRWAFAPELWLFLAPVLYGIWFWYGEDPAKLPMLLKIPVTLFIVVLILGATAISLFLVVGFVMEMLLDENPQKRVALFLFACFLFVMAFLTGN